MVKDYLAEAGIGGDILSQAVTLSAQLFSQHDDC